MHAPSSPSPFHSVPRSSAAAIAAPLSNAPVPVAQFAIGPCCFLPHDEAGAILVSLPASPLLAGLTYVLGALDLPFVAATPPTPAALQAATLVITDEPNLAAISPLPVHVRAVVFSSDTGPDVAANVVRVHPSTSTADLLDLAAAWASTEVAALSDREREILALVSRGHSNEEIAAHCFVSTATVKTHLLRTFRKLGVSDRASAVYKAVKMGLIV